MTRWFGRSRPLARTPVQTRTEGFLDRIEAGWLHGWARRPHHPDRRVRVRVLVDGRGVTEDLADQYRADLAETGHGDGRYGFSIALPDALLDSRTHRVEVVDAETGTFLRASTRRHLLARKADPAQAALDRVFDPGFYETQAGAVSFPLDHYREIGWQQGFDPHQFFSTKHYLAHNGPIAGDPLTHFVETGQFTSVWTHPLLDPDAKAVQPAPRRRKDRSGSARDADGLDEAAMGSEALGFLHPLLAYLGGGSQPAHSIGRLFSDADYRARYPDVDGGHLPPLLHYLRYGRREGRRPHPDFDPDLFAELMDLDARVEPFTHFLAWLSEGAAQRASAVSTRRGTPVRLSAVESAPAVSVVVLNHNKSLLTLQCLCVLAAHTNMVDVEVIVVDNGSRLEDFARLTRFAHGATVVRVDVNRGFGEGNNIGAEHARGRVLMFLNNDAFVRPGWLAPLRAAIEGDDAVGAAGAKLLYPDGRLQEAGATISACGTAVQRGKHLDPRAPAFNRHRTVDYCSAAALMVRADAFRAALGFDLAWDPAYYEDADLCLRLRLMGLATLYVPDSEVIHLEHATSADAGLDLRLHDIVATNRLKFVARWGAYLDEPPPRRTASQTALCPPATVRPADAAPAPAPTRAAALFTPYTLSPGGGERYLLTAAATLSDHYRCHLLTPDRYSRMRLLTVGRELGLDLDRLRIEVLSEASAIGSIDLFVCMANEVLPPMRGLGRLNLYHCQFPFPMHPTHFGRGWRTLASYQAVVVNSAFTAGRFAADAAALGIDPPPLRVLSPPVVQADGRRDRQTDGVARILSVGRFAPDGHCKRQDLMIPAFADLLERVAGPVELHLAGAVPGESAARVYLQGLVEAARGLPVTFHPNASADAIARLYDDADLYWHLTGAGQDPGRHPELFEHFGIALCEAMSAGAVPVALGGGGPAEIVTDGRDGLLIDHARDLVPASARLLEDPARRNRMSVAARKRAAEFSPQVFAAGLHALVAEFDPLAEFDAIDDARLVPHG